MLYNFFGRKSLGSAVTCAWTETSAMQDTQDKKQSYAKQKFG